MKSILIKLSLLLGAVLVIVASMALLEAHKLHEQNNALQQSLLNQVSFKIDQIIQQSDFSKIESRRDAMALISLEKRVVSVALFENAQMIDTTDALSGLDVDSSAVWKLNKVVPGQPEMRLDIVVKLFRPSQPITAQWVLANLVILSVAIMVTYWLFLPVLKIERFANRILLGDIKPEHLTESEQFSSALALNRLVSEYTKLKQEQKELSNRLREHSFVDKQTGLGNREYFDAELEVHLSAEKNTVNGAVVFFSFEPLSDYYHQEPERFNKLIVEVGHYLMRFSDELDLCWVARRDSLEFSMLLLESAPETVKRQCVQVIRDLQRTVFDDSEFRHYFIDIGGVFFSSGEAMYDVLSSADLALRQAQLSGENQIQLNTSYQTNVIKGGVRWRTFLNQVLEQRELALYFQEQVHSEPHSSHRYEVLARVKDNKKIIPASIFIPMTNRCGLATQFDRLIVDKSLKMLSFGKFDKSIELSINLFIDSLFNDTFMSWLTQRLSQAHGVVEQIIFELPESGVFRKMEQLEKPMTQLSQLGVRWCIEHVGSPNADLRYLSRLPISSLKLNRTLFQHSGNLDKSLFINSVVASASSLNIEVWAEGIENEQDWHTCKQMQLTGAQGYHLSDIKDHIPGQVVEFKRN